MGYYKPIVRYVFLADVGGSLGLFLGLNVVSVVQYACALTCKLHKKLRTFKKVCQKEQKVESST